MMVPTLQVTVSICQAISPVPGQWVGSTVVVEDPAERIPIATVPQKGICVGCVRAARSTPGWVRQRRMKLRVSPMSSTQQMMSMVEARAEAPGITLACVCRRPARMPVPMTAGNHAGPAPGRGGVRGCGLSRGVWRGVRGGQEEGSTWAWCCFPPLPCFRGNGRGVRCCFES